MGLTKTDRKRLEFEVVSERARLRLTRLLRQAPAHKDPTVEIVRQNRVINISRNVLGLQLYQLEAVDGEYYYPAEHGWHNGEI